jgi:hypothetical protein
LLTFLPEIWWQSHPPVAELLLQCPSGCDSDGDPPPVSGHPVECAFTLFDNHQNLLSHILVGKFIRSDFPA